jgi:hypothetical protein
LSCKYFIHAGPYEECKMHTMNPDQLVLVSGGGDGNESGALATGWGTGFAASSVISEAGGLRVVPAAMRLAAGGAAGFGLYAAYKTGDAIGTALHKNETIAGALAAAIDWVFGTWDGI